MEKTVERVLWSIAIPGFGQFLNGKIVKGIALILLEFLINSRAHLNQVILLSFQGHTHEAIQNTDYQWLMFYPCVYMFAIWDAYRDAGGGVHRFSYLPFILAAYLGTVGIMYSHFLLGPVFLPMALAIVGVFVGSLLRLVIIMKV